MRFPFANDHKIADGHPCHGDLHLDPVAAKPGAIRGVWSSSRWSSFWVRANVTASRNLTDQGDQDDLGRHERLADDDRRQAGLRPVRYRRRCVPCARASTAP